MSKKKKVVEEVPSVEKIEIIVPKTQSFYLDSNGKNVDVSKLTKNGKYGIYNGIFAEKHIKESSVISYYVLMVGAELFNFSLHTASFSSAEVLKMMRVSKACYDEFVKYLETKNEARYRSADSLAIAQ